MKTPLLLLLTGMAALYTAYGDPNHGGLEVTEHAISVPHDTVPRFANVSQAGSPVLINMASGDFSDPSIWPANQVPGDDARIQIAPYTIVTYDLDSAVRYDCIEVREHARLEFATDQTTSMLVNEIMVLPEGELIIGDETHPIQNEVSAEIIFRGDSEPKTGTVENPGMDPKQYGRGLIVFGKATMHGRAMDRTFLRFAVESLAGESTLQLESEPIGWRPGDRLLIPDTRQHAFRKNETFTSQAEEVIIERLEGAMVHLTEALVYDHKGPRDVEGNVGPIERTMLPHVGNLTRNIILRSENPADNQRRGHTIYLHRAEIDLRYAVFQDLGRTTIEALDSTVFDEHGALEKIGTNQIGRYSLHLHHLWGPENPENTGYQYTVVGNVIEGMKKWGMTIHNAHYGLIKDNIAYAGEGSAIATEEGNEAYNVIERNFVVHTRAGDTQQILGHSVGRGGVFNGRALFGTTRDAFWFSGEYNYVRDNVAANTPDFAFNYNGYYIKDTMRIPRYRGADLSDPDAYEGWNYHGRTAAFVEGRDRREGLPVLESARNEAYSSGQGLWLTWARGCCGVDYYKQVSLFKDYRFWHINHTGVYAYHESRNTYQGFIMRNDPEISLLSGPYARLNRGFYFGTSSYENGQLVVNDFDVQGFNIGLVLSPNPQDGTEEPNITLVENGVLKNHVNIQENYPAISDGRKTIIRNVHFVPTHTYASNALPGDPINLWMNDSRIRQSRPMRPSETWVYDFNGVVGHSFQVYWNEQAPDVLVPLPARPDLHTGDRTVTCPEEGLTNRGCLEAYGVTTAGNIAPCIEHDGDGCEAASLRATQLGVVGLVFPLVADTPATYQSWLRDHFDESERTQIELSAEDADPDADGTKNLIEYLLRRNPRVSEPTARPLYREGRENDRYVLVMPKPRPDVTALTEISRDLITWYTDASHLELGEIMDNGDGTQTRFLRLRGDMVGADAVFLRLRAILD